MATLGEFKAGDGEAVIFQATANCLLLVKDFNFNKTNTFLDYTFGGCEVGLHIGVDFTLSNGDPTNEHSLHFLDSNKENDYVRAISAIMDTIKDYDVDEKYPIYGFGAMLPQTPEKVSSHCFALNGCIFDPEQEGK
mmetsp:Transcript_28338/g.42907  ORF Transcript_28338/g.42907 Transcript_28338/m.42907 type:complete len:136 (+) Transcript_28338:1-408(+)